MPPIASYTPHVEIIKPPVSPMVQGAAWWIVGVVAFVCFGLGLAVGLLASG